MSGAARGPCCMVPVAMHLRAPGSLPFGFRLNRPMVVGIVIALAGLAVYMGGVAGLWREDSLLATIAYGVVLVGILLYFIGRVVQIVGDVRRR